jgi:hypothetical protein
VKNEGRRCTCPETLMANLMSHTPRCEYETLPLPLCLCLLQSTPVKNSAEYMKSFLSEIFPTPFLSLSLSVQSIRIQSLSIKLGIKSSSSSFWDNSVWPIAQVC